MLEPPTRSAGRRSPTSSCPASATPRRATRSACSTQGHPRSRAGAARSQGRAAQDRQFPAGRRRLSARGPRRADAQGDRAPPQRRCRGVRPLHRRSRDGRSAAQEMAAARAAQCRRKLSMLPKMLGIGARHGGLVAGRNAGRHRLCAAKRCESARRYFTGEIAKALFGFDGVVGNFASPYTPGTAYVLLHHLFGEAAGVPGAWGHAIGGMGSITQAMARAAARRGSISCSITPVEEVIVERQARRGRRRGRQGVAREGSGRGGQSQTAVRPAGAARRGRAEVDATDARVEMRKRDLPDECRAVRAAQVHACCPRRAII